ncbi:hypothetical protein Rsub_03316 [Raphidocelis subcapitata]|uniref:IC97/Casc1 N-terminal domain-containing protein n=1 Tax=Raphidocelis subcapitata TaxID=307507 RepID=A0A2V0NX91_9CHLO|nr:hypothetical protein Rsub_03316 [Raphidocelis subcapitata]|eukprot:GBF90183.1 hypothetical protein Rsub_03316 [Raphidocelis subcapitata]
MPEAKKKLTKEQARKKREEEARLAEEERLKQEEEARRIAAEREQKRQQLLAQHLQAQAERIAHQRNDARRTARRLAAERAAAAAARAAEAEWARHVACPQLPDPRSPAAMNGHLSALREAPRPRGADEALAAAGACLELAEECRRLALEAEMTSAAADCLALLAADGPAGAEGLPGSDAAAAADEPAAAPPQLHDAGSPAAPQQPAGPPGAERSSPAPAPGGPPPRRRLAAGDAARLRGYEEELYAHARRALDAATAGALYEELANARGECHAEARRGGLGWGVWANPGRNPRARTAEWKALGVTAELPRQLAASGAALRVLRLPFDALSRRAACGGGAPGGAGALSALGGAVLLDALALPPPAKKAGGWTVRQVTPHAAEPQPAPWPDAAARDAPAPPPVVLSFQVPGTVVVPLSSGGGEGSSPNSGRASGRACGGERDGGGGGGAATEGDAHQPTEPQPSSPPQQQQQQQQTQQQQRPDPRVGWWDEAAGRWSEEGVGAVRFNPSTRLLAFPSSRLGAPHALVAPRLRLLPYRSWDLRPTGGLGGATVALTLRVASCAALPDPVIIEAGPAWARLLSPRLPELSGLLEARLPPWRLLLALADAGLNLMPVGGGGGDGGDGGNSGGGDSCGDDCGGGGGGGEEGGRKDAAIERAMCDDVSRVCGTFLVASSRWNPSLGPRRCCCRLSEVVDWEAGGRTRPEHAARVFERERASGERRVLVAVREGTEGVALLDAPDRGPGPPRPRAFDTVDAVVAAAADPAAQLHFDLPSALAGPPDELAPHPRWAELRASGAGLEGVAAFDAAASETAAQLLCALRPFSYG